MVLVDTSVWIEFFRARDPVYSQLTRLLLDREAATMECVFAELMQGAKDRHERAMIVEMWESLPKLRSKDSLLRAGEASGFHKWRDKGVGLIDAWIITAAREAKAKVWSLDKKMLSLLDAKEVHVG
jgi:predicted nucleic acid-binding protein